MIVVVIIAKWNGNYETSSDLVGDLVTTKINDDFLIITNLL